MTDLAPYFLMRLPLLPLAHHLGRAPSRGPPQQQGGKPDFCLQALSEIRSESFSFFPDGFDPLLYYLK